MNFQRQCEKVIQYGFHSVMAVPLSARGATLGVATFVRHQRPEPFDAEDLETDGTGFVKLKGSEEKKIHITDLAGVVLVSEDGRDAVLAVGIQRRRLGGEDVPRRGDVAGLD